MRKAEGDKLGAEKGINVPETSLTAASLTAEDLQALPFIVKHADMLGYSFVRTEDDVRLLQSHLDRTRRREPGHGAQDRNPGRIRQSARFAAGGDAAGAAWA